MAPKVIQITKNLEMGEGPHWDDQAKALYFVNMLHSEIHKYVPATNTHTHGVVVGPDGEKPITFVIPVEGESDTFLVGYGGKLATVQWDGVSNFTKSFKLLAVLEKKYPDVRLNDGKASPSGIPFAGSMGAKQHGEFPLDQGNLFAYSGSVTKPILKEIGIGNGLAWTSDEKTFYYIDSLSGKVVAFDYDAEAISISDERVAYDFAENDVFQSPDVIPDGMTIDVNGNLWVAVIGSGKVFHVNPKTSTVISTIEFPCTQITSVAFGGPYLEDLYVTSAFLDLSEKQIEKQPKAGCLFKVTGLGTKGLAGVPAKL